MSFSLCLSIYLSLPLLLLECVSAHFLVRRRIVINLLLLQACFVRCARAHRSHSDAIHKRRDKTKKTTWKHENHFQYLWLWSILDWTHSGRPATVIAHDMNGPHCECIFSERTPVVLFVSLFVRFFLLDDRMYFIMHQLRFVMCFIFCFIHFHSNSNRMLTSCYK